MLLNLIKKFTKKILYNKTTHFYDQKYITYENINNKFYRKKKIFNKNDYLHFLIKKTREHNIKDRLLKKIFITIYTIVHELSAECSHKNIDIIIENKINNLELGELSEIFQTTCPTGFNIKLKKKKKIIFLINKNSKTNKYFKIIISKKQIKIKNNFTTYNLIVDTKEKKIIGVQRLSAIKKKTTVNNCKKLIKISEFNFYKKTIKNFNQINDEGIQQYLIKKEKFFICNYKILNQKTCLEFIKKKKIFFNKKNYNIILTIKDSVISYRGLISLNNHTIKESINHSIWDGSFKIENNKILLPKITKTISGKAIIFPTAHGSLGHYALESINRLYYLKKISDYKIIVYENLPDYLLKIFFALGIKSKQILKKNLNESWKIKELLFPIIPWFEISKNEVNFLGSLPKLQNKNSLKKSYDKIYISRADSRDNRNLINEKEIEYFLKSKGYKILLASKLDINKKIQIFSKAKIIITPLGSAIHNFLFCKKINAKVILIGTKKYFIKDYIQYAFLKKLNLHFIEATEIPSYTDAWQYNHSSFFLNPIILDKTLKIL
jgi:capsular polysaccharide biosynthesis protein